MTSAIVECEPASPAPPRRIRAHRRLYDIDRAKGLAILLVVVGHLVARTPPAGNDWYLALKGAIYQFHMPFFMFLSGVVLGCSLPSFGAPRDYLTYVGKKFLRLAPAYLLFGVAVLGGKLLLQQVAPVDNPPEGFLAGLGEMLLRPTSSSNASLWYIYVLMEFYVLVPLLLALTGRRVWPLVVLGVALQTVAIENFLMADRVCELLLYLALGIAVARHYDIYTAVLDRVGLTAVALFAAALSGWFLAPVPQWAIALLSLPALHALVRRTPLARSEVLLVLGQYCFAIYLMNTIAIGLVKAALWRWQPWDGSAFLIYAPLLLAGGVLLPIAIKRWVFARVPVLDRITA